MLEPCIQGAGRISKRVWCSLSIEILVIFRGDRGESDRNRSMLTGWTNIERVKGVIS